MTTAEEIREQIRRNGYIEPIDVPRDGRPGSQPKPVTKTPKSKTASGRFQVLNQFVDESARLVSTAAVACWLVLFRETKPDGLARIAYAQIGECLGIQRRAAMRLVQELSTAGLVEVVQRGTTKGHTPSTYRVYSLPTRRAN